MLATDGSMAAVQLQQQWQWQRALGARGRRQRVPRCPLPELPLRAEEGRGQTAASGQSGSTTNEVL